MLESLDGPAIIEGGKFFYPANLSKENLNDGQVYPGKKWGSIRFNSIESPVFPGPTLEEIADFVAFRKSGEFLDEINNELKTQLKNSVVKREDLCKNEDKLLYTIIFKLMPNFVLQSKEILIQKALKEKKSTLDDDELVSYILSNIDVAEYSKFLLRIEGYEMNELEAVENKLKSESPDSCWKRVWAAINKTKKPVDDRDFLINTIIKKSYGLEEDLFFLHKGSIFKLQKTEEKEGLFLRQESVYKRGEEYKVDIKGIVTRTAKDKMLFLEKERIIREIEQTKYKIRELPLKKAALLMYLRNLNEFELEEFGFRKEDDNRYIVYLKIPEYVLENNKGELFLFPAVKMGIEAKINDSIITFGVPNVLSNYRHPFLYQSISFKRQICLGEYEYSSSPDTIDMAVEALLIGKKILLAGYVPGNNEKGMRSGNPYYALDSTNFGDYMINKNHPKIRNGEVKITNK